MNPQWHFCQDGAQYGPVDEADIVLLIQNGDIPPNAVVCQVGGAHWQPAHDHGCFQVEIFPRRLRSTPESTPESTPKTETVTVKVDGHEVSVPKLPPESGSAQQPASVGEVEHPPKQTPVEAMKTLFRKHGALKYVAACFPLFGIVFAVLIYSVFFSTLSDEELGEEAFGELQDNDAGDFINNCTVYGFPNSKFEKFTNQFTGDFLDKDVELAKITQAERDRQLQGFKNKFKIYFRESDMKEGEDKIKEEFKGTIEAGKKAGLNWEKAKFEYVDTSEFVTSESPNASEELPSGHGRGALYVVISENAKRYKIKLEDCIIVPGYGCIITGGISWDGVIRQ